MPEIKIDVPAWLYMMIVGTCAIVTGFGLVLYCKFYYINIAYVETLSNPILYLGIGSSCILFGVFLKKMGWEIDMDTEVDD